MADSIQNIDGVPGDVERCTLHDSVVGFDGSNDPYKPTNWCLRKKILTTLLYALCTMSTTFAASVYSPASTLIASHFGVSKEVALIGLTFGFLEFGPVIWAPLSELYGRKWTVFGPCLLAAIFSFGTATSKDIQTVLITRFFTGFFGSAPVSTTGGVLGDIWSPAERGYAVMGYSMAVFLGPALGPIIGGGIVQGGLGWKWTEYIAGIVQLAVLILGVFCVDETYEPVLLLYKARRLRQETKNWALHAKFEGERENLTFAYYAYKYGARPLRIIVTPISFAIALYSAFEFGVFYATLAAFPILFQNERGWNDVQGGLPFLALIVGVLFAAIVVVLNQAFHYNPLYRAAGNKPVPEARLPPMMIGSIALAGGLFLLAWTSDARFPWIYPVIGIALVGFGFMTILQGALNYVVDTFTVYSASAIAANTFVRTITASTFPLFVDPLYARLGNEWATTCFAFVAVILSIIPYLFWVYGPDIRKRGRYSA